MEVATISIIISIILSFITLIKIITRPIKKILKLQEKQTNGIRCLLRKEIFETINRAEERGYIFQDELEILRKLYINYHDLKGNGIIDKLMSEVMHLEIKRR